MEVGEQAGQIISKDVDITVAFVERYTGIQQCGRPGVECRGDAGQLLEK